MTVFQKYSYAMEDRYKIHTLSEYEQNLSAGFNLNK